MAKRRSGGEIVVGLVIGAGLFAIVWRLLRPRAGTPMADAPAPPADETPEVPPAGPDAKEAEVAVPAPEVAGRTEGGHPENDGSFPADSPGLPPEPVDSDAPDGDNEEDENGGGVS